MEFVDRKYWIDTAKGYAMFLVFYSHLIVWFIGRDSLALQTLRFVSSFMLPVFLTISGLLSKTTTNLSFFDFIKLKFLTRIIPILFFNLMLFIPALIAYTDANKAMSELLMLFISGDTSLNVPTWFLVCFFTLEIIHYFIKGFLTNFKRILLIFILFFAAGMFVSYEMNNICIFGYKIFKFWGLGEAFTAYSLYIVGFIMRKYDVINKIKSRINWLILTCSSLAVALLTFDLNKGPFKNSSYYVDMASSSHGNIFLFMFTAISGSIFLISLSKLIPKIKPLIYIGKNSLIFMGLNGFFFSFINKRLIQWLSSNFLGHLSYLSPLTCITAAVAELAICVPFVYILSKYFPELIGNIKAQGVISARIIKAHKTADY